MAPGSPPRVSGDGIIAALFRVSRPSVYRSLERTAALPPLPADTRPAPDVARYDQLLTRPH